MFSFGFLRLCSLSTEGYRYLRDLEYSLSLALELLSTRILVKNLPIIRNFVLKGFGIFDTGINNECVLLDSYEFRYNKSLFEILDLKVATSVAHLMVVGTSFPGLSPIMVVSQTTGALFYYKQCVETFVLFIYFFDFS